MKAKVISVIYCQKINLKKRMIRQFDLRINILNQEQRSDVSRFKDKKNEYLDDTHALDIMTSVVLSCQDIELIKREESLSSRLRGCALSIHQRGFA